MTTQGMWQMLSDLLDGEKLPDSLNKDIYDLCEGKAVVVCNSIEPVAHRFKWEEQEEWQYGDGYDATGAPNDPDYFAYEPLYTHPMRELTNEEIMDVANEVFNTYKNWGYYQIDFARAILKKASEK
jgi:hypothetical protein